MTAVTLGPTFVVDGPLPRAPRFGLLDVAQIAPPGADPHWMNGVTVESYTSDLPSVWAPCQEGSTADIKADGGGIDLPVFGPFTVYLPVTCNTVSSRPDERFRSRAMAAFTAKEGWGVEKEFAQGNSAPSNPHLADGNVTILNAAAVSALEALSKLENAIAATAEGGVIHATPALVTVWASTYNVLRNGNTVETAIGTPVVVGTGYVGTKPVGGTAPAGTKEWAFATGPVQIRRSEAYIPGDELQNINTATNEKTSRVERDYVVDWDTSLQVAAYADRVA